LNTALCLHSSQQFIVEP